MANFQIHEDVENDYPHVAAKKLVTAHAAGIKHGQKKHFLENRETLRLIENGTRVDGKKVKLCGNENEKEIIKQEKKKQPEVEESFLKVEKENKVHRVKKERDSFPLNLLHNDEYKQEIWRYLRFMEETGPRPKSTYMMKQVDINWQSRSILIDWLSSVAEEYKFCDETFHLSVNYIDRFLSHISVVRQKFQLVGAAAMMVATKMEEYQPLDSREWSYLTGDSFSPKQVLKMEQLILKVLSYKMHAPTIHGFIQQLSTEYGIDEKTLHLAMYLSELVLLEGAAYLDHYPSKLASACVALARFTLSKRNAWPGELRRASGYSLMELGPVVRRQHETFRNSPTRELKAIRTKYSSPKFNRVALVRPRNLVGDEFDKEE